MAGICVQACESHSDCDADAGERCCSNGCGVACLPGVYPTSICSAVRDDVLNRSLIGAYVPQCEEGGYFSPVQCHASTGYCWCVHAQTGEPISDARQFTEPQCQNCSYREEVYFVGEDFPAGDGCNSCTCQEDGSVICSQIPVPCSVSPDDDGLTGFFSCPPPPSDVAGVCSEDCSSSSDCDPGQKCCSNNCGHTCADPVPVPYLAPPLRCPAPETLPGICDLPTCEECADGFLCCENPCGGTMCAEGVSDPAPCQALLDQSTGDLLGAYNPWCSADGKFKSLQCHENSCWCVDPDTGKPESDLVLAQNVKMLECADCLYGEEFYSAGQSFPTGDGCNSCTCQEDGSTVCSQRPVPCPPHPPHPPHHPHPDDGDRNGEDEDSSSHFGDGHDDDDEDDEDLIWWHSLLIGSGVTIILLVIGMVMLLFGLAFVIRRNQFHHRILKESDSDSCVALTEPDTDVVYKQVPDSIELKVPVADSEPAKA